jgi:alpha-beta hydrolase superfamily lysophospholipase
VRALIEWNEKVVESYPPSQTPLLIIQGTEDTVVEWRYNIPFLQRKLPQSQVSYLEGAQHDLLWEAPPIRQKVFDQILNFLGSIKGLW